MPERADASVVASNIPEAKIVALREALAKDHWVKFSNGSQVEYEDCKRCLGRGEVPEPAKFTRDPEEVAEMEPCPTCGGEGSRLLVTRAIGGARRYRLDTEIRAAYEMALNGPRSKQQPRERDHGDVPY